MIFILIGLVYGIIWGVVCNAVVHNKGYEENWFWWGFFFGVFAFLVAVTKPTITNTKLNYSYESISKPEPVRVVNRTTIVEKPVDSMWKCKNCGNMNSGTLNTCTCGNTKLLNFSWTCIECGRINSENKYICECGTKKSQSTNILKTSIATENNTSKVDETKDSNNADILKKFKELLDMGAITQDEFDAKKKQILGL